MAARLALVLLVLSLRASADPVVVVRARMRIELEHVERVGHGMVVAGRLLDEGQDEPIGLGTVALKVGLLGEDGSESFRYGSAMAVDEEGNFRFEVPLGAPVRYLLRLTAPGTGLHEGAAPLERELDFALRPIELRLFVPAEQPADSLTLPVSVEAVALDRNDVSNGAAEPKAEDDLPVDVELDGVPTATLVLKGSRASTQLPLHAKPGQEVSVRVRFTGDSTRGPAEATARVRLVEKGLMTITVEPTRVALGSDIKLRGTLRFGERTVGGLPVIVRLAGDDSRPGVSVTTDPGGAFEATLRTPDEGTRAGYEAVFRDGDAKARGLPPARSPVLVVELLPGFSLTDLGARPAGAALAIAAALLVVLGLLRAGALFATRKAAPKPAVPPAPRPRATLRTASDRRVSGRVLDDERRTPLAGARVELTVGDDVNAVYTDERGGFSLAPGDGAATLVVERAGFAPATLRGAVPHRGEWATLEVRLPPLRAELLRRYGAALATSVPSGEALGLRTPRELALVALRHRPTLDAKALRTLRAWIEVSCFGPTSPPAGSLDHLGKLVDDLATHSSLPSPPPRP